MQNKVFATIVKLAIVSLLVGMALAFFGITPRGLLENLGSTVVGIYEIVLSFGRWSLAYVLIGAVVVVPVWMVFFLIGVARGRRLYDKREKLKKQTQDREAKRAMSEHR